MDQQKPLTGLREAIEAAGAEIRYLPPYSPDLNPIQQMFAKLEALLRKIAARSVGALWTAIGQLVSQFAPEECANYFRNSGMYGWPESALSRHGNNECS